ncbi:hypothetical protein Ccrd_006016, partial [Cynara cardunculus var. scolymus]
QVGYWSVGGRNYDEVIFQGILDKSRVILAVERQLAVGSSFRSNWMLFVFGEHLGRSVGAARSYGRIHSFSYSKEYKKLTNWLMNYGQQTVRAARTRKLLTGDDCPLYCRYTMVQLSTSPFAGLFGVEIGLIIKITMCKGYVPVGARTCGRGYVPVGARTCGRLSVTAERQVPGYAFDMLASRLFLQDDQGHDTGGWIRALVLSVKNDASNGFTLGVSYTASDDDSFKAVIWVVVELMSISMAGYIHQDTAIRFGRTVASLVLELQEVRTGDVNQGFRDDASSKFVMNGYWVHHHDSYCQFLWVVMLVGRVMLVFFVDSIMDFPCCLGLICVSLAKAVFLDGMPVTIARYGVLSGLATDVLLIPITIWSNDQDHHV